MHGSHLLLHYSRTQAGVSLSSAEAELNAALKMDCEILGISQFCSEFGYTMKTPINGDSSAVKGVFARRGCEKVKHLELEQLWLQQQVRSGKVEFQKISRKNNPSDALTHHYTREEAKKHFKHMGIEFMPTSSEAVRGAVCANLGEIRDVIEEEATCVGLLGSPPLGNDTRGGSTTKKGVDEEASKRYGKTSWAGEARQQRCQELVASSGNG